MNYDYQYGRDPFDDDDAEKEKHASVKLVLIVVIILLSLAAFCYAGPKERVAIAEAAVWCAQNQFPEGENDYDGSKAGNIPEAPESSEPRIEYAAGLTPITTNVEGLTATIYTAESRNGDGWCARCNTLKRDWGNGNAQVRLLWSRDPVPERGEAIYPAIRFNGVGGYSMPTQGGRYFIPASLGELEAILEKHSGEASQAVAAVSGSAGAIHAKDHVRAVLAWWRANIGEGVKAEMRWDRSGAQSFPLLAKADWSPVAVFGKYGHMDLSAKGAVGLPVDAIGFGYRVDGDDITIDADPLTLKGLGQAFNPAAKQSLTTGPSQIGPGAVLTIVSVVRGLWSLLNPSADLQLGGNVSATAALTGDTLAIDFQQCPSVKLVALFTFQLRVDRVEIVEDKQVRVVFGGSRLIKERTFSLK
ncbi:hypothetical protein [Schlesneria sp. T3-172]|uniref:hypothetical protein n=1 Tax=Schlesneria sphaerica TaxID=3373610 RepID=UPI0037CA5237